MVKSIYGAGYSACHYSDYSLHNFVLVLRAMGPLVRFQIYVTTIFLGAFSDCRYCAERSLVWVCVTSLLSKGVNGIMES